jgi:uncharacterized protein
MAAPLNTCTTIEQRGVVRFFVGKKYGCIKGYAQRNAAHMDSRPARPRTQHDYHHDTKVKAEAATAVIELLMMGGKTPETC